VRRHQLYNVDDLHDNVIHRTLLDPVIGYRMYQNRPHSTGVLPFSGSLASLALGIDIWLGRHGEASVANGVNQTYAINGVNRRTLDDEKGLARM
jgi:hypothetical protein